MVARDGQEGRFAYFFAFGSYPGEPPHQRGRRRILVGTWWIAAAAISIRAVFEWVGGFPLLGLTSGLSAGAVLAALLAIRRWPRRFPWVLNGLLTAWSLTTLAQTTLLGGLESSGLAAMWGLTGVLAALIGLSVRAAAAWLVAFLAQVWFALWVPTVIEPRYVVEDHTGNIVFTLVAVGILSFAVMAYFVRQRDAFQEQSDRLLRNVLPEEIAARLKLDDDNIADYFEQATVLFADVVGFTPMSAGMTPQSLVSLLGEVFTDLDVFVGELGLEKIKTVGDEYMVAAGVPSPRPDHVEAIAELALLIRDHVATKEYGVHTIQFRIGIHTGPVIAGVIGQRKFAYDLWGDTVNRLESHGIPGEIQISAATYDRLKDSFVCEPRGLIEVKGKGQLETWILRERASVSGSRQ